MAKSYCDDMIDLAIKHAGHELLKEMAAPRLSGEERFSDGFEKRMNRIIGAEKRRRGRSKAVRVASKVAAAIAVLLIISTAVIFSSEALRVKVMSMFHNAGRNGSTDVQFYDGTNIPAGMIVPKYMPEGFTVKGDPQKNGRMFMSDYVNQEGKTIHINQVPEGGSSAVDSDGIAAYPTEIKGRPAFVSYDEKQSIILFNYDTFDFSLIGQVDVSELTKVAESMID